MGISCVSFPPPMCTYLARCGPLSKDFFESSLEISMKTFPIIQEAVTTQSRQQIVDLTAVVQAHISRRQVTEGMAIIYVPHTTAAVTINENHDADVKHDMLEKLSALVPKSETFYNHDEGNSDSHVKTALVGNSATLLIENGKLVLGPWQGIYFCEFDGPRERRVIVKIVEWGVTSSS
jgi:secondary thiamine-phosphate synthase enzyme